MTIFVGDINLGPTFEVIDLFEEVERLGFAYGMAIIDADGDEMPEGAPEQAIEILDRPTVVLSTDARYLLELIAGRANPNTDPA